MVLPADIRELVVVDKQRTPEWFRERLKLITASELPKVLGKNRHKSRERLIRDKVEQNPRNLDALPPIAWGRKFEPMAIEAYKRLTGNTVDEVGLVVSRTHPYFGASPDGLVNGGEKVLEVMCPYTRTVGTGIPPEYVLQMQGQMHACEATTGDYFECKFVETDRVEQDDLLFGKYDENGTPDVLDDPEGGVQWALRSHFLQTLDADTSVIPDAYPKIVELMETVERYIADPEAYKREMPQTEKTYFTAEDVLSLCRHYDP